MEQIIFPRTVGGTRNNPVRVEVSERVAQDMDEQIVGAAFSMLRRPRSESRAVLALVRAHLWRTWNEWQVVYLAECA